MNAPLPFSSLPDGFSPWKRPPASPRKRRLHAGRVLVVGRGALASSLALHLAAAGVGTLGLLDPGSQAVAADGSGEGSQLASSLNGAATLDRLLELNPQVRVNHHVCTGGLAGALGVVGTYDLVADVSEVLAQRFLINDACARAGVANVYVALFHAEGLLGVFAPGRGPCFRCLCPHVPEPVSQRGVMARLPAAVSALHAAEVVKLLAGSAPGLVGKGLRFDIAGMCFEDINRSANPACPMCSTPEFAPGLATAANDPHLGQAVPSVSAGFLRARLASSSPPVVLDVRTREEARAASIPQSRQIPLHELESRLGELDPQAEIVCYCHSGSCAAQAVRLLTEHGFGAAVCLRGGLQAWLVTEHRSPDSTSER